MADVDELEFWWLSAEDRRVFQYIAPAFQDKLPNCCVPALIYGERIGIGELGQWCERHNSINVHRELLLYKLAIGDCQTLEGPILLDFDNEEENLDSACRCTAEALRFLRHNLGIDLSADCKVFFSGRKGFHIEVRTTVIPPKLLKQRPKFRQTFLDLALIKYVRGVSNTQSDDSNWLDEQGTVLDLQKPAKRINGSVNAWSSNNEIKRRKMILIPANELLSEKSSSLVQRLIRQSDVSRPSVK